MRSLALVVLIMLILQCSCKKLVTSEFPDFGPFPAVNSILVSGEPLKVHVSLAGKLDTTQLAVVENADISLFINGSYAENLSFDADGIYYSSSIVEPLKSYKLEVNIPGFETITCIDSIPSPSAILNIFHNSNAGKDEEGVIYPSVTISFNTKPLENQYFEIVVRLLGKYRIKTNLFKITDPILLNEGLPLTIFSNEIIRDSVYTMKINYNTGGYSSRNGTSRYDLYPMIIELRSISSSYYKFVKQKYLYEIGRDPEFLATSTNAFQLFSNVPGGYGIFAGYSVVVSDTINPQN